MDTIFKLTDEDSVLAFKREVLEETGCRVEIIKKLGIVEEYRFLKKLKQISCIFVAKVIENLDTLNLTEKEKKEGAKLLWETPEKALDLITNCYDKLLPSEYNDIYHTKFTVLRDRKILKYYLDSK